MDRFLLFLGKKKTLAHLDYFADSLNDPIWEHCQKRMHSIEDYKAYRLLGGCYLFLNSLYKGNFKYTMYIQYLYV